MNDNIPVAEANEDKRLAICLPANISEIPLDPEKHSWQTNALEMLV